MKTIRVSLPERSYSIYISDSYRALPEILRRAGLPPEGWVISHRQLLDRLGTELLPVLRRAGWRLQTITVPASERSKSSDVAQRVIRRLAQSAAMRVPVLFAFGGGVVGDLTGFVASVFRRGVPYVQLPTTLLAQVDSAIGGKVGVDLPEAKNLVGAFYQPQAVVNHVRLLRHLPSRQRRSGLAEIVKYGVIADPELFAFLERHTSACLSLNPRAVERIIERSCRIKARVVSRDERETTGLRTQLNFGHTVGHALEAAGRFRRFTHGEAIAIGMVVASQIALELNLWDPTAHERLVQLLRSFGLPTHARARGILPASVWRALRYDKKFVHGRPRWVLPTRIGRVIVTERVPEPVVKRILRHYLT